ncbi:MAG TPA: DUF3857 and transglutaminase domain-containing protein [Telluria sp.]|nr:DUF3857 and transglutaminase domain-containing protein [Telluria sp.]
MRSFLCGCLLALGSVCASAQDTGTDPSLVVNRYVQHFVVEPDGAYILTIDNARTIREPRAVQEHAQYTITYNSTLDEVLEVRAATHKQDGRVVPVQPEHIRDQQEAASADAPMFQDTRVKVVVFPDVEVGDRMEVHYVLRRRSALFPGQFEDLSASAFYANPDFHLIYDMPASLPLHADAVGFEEVPDQSPPGRRRYHWHYVPGPNQRIEAQSVSYLDYGKRLAVSTFGSYADFAKAYDARARAAAVPDEAIAALARALTTKLDEPRSKALALSEWVRKNIRYVAVYVGAGGVVPHDAATVLRNRYGDCKDHASLLVALLAAAGIDATPALVNSGNAYKLPSAPTLGVFNHVITYVPALNLYLDPTADSIAAGFLPAAVRGKPVLLTRSGQLASTPYAQPERTRTLARFGIERDGRSRFSVTKTSEGAIAEAYRSAVRASRPSERELFVERMLQGLGQKGVGSVDVGAVDGGGSRYTLRFTGESENFAYLPGPVGIASSFNFWGGLGEAVMSLAQEKERRQDFVCPPLEAEDETRFELPRGVRVLALPPPLRVQDANLRYRSSTRKEGNAVVVKRQIAFRHAGLVCTPQEFRRLRPLVDRMIRDLKSQVILQG